MDKNLKVSFTDNTVDIEMCVNTICEALYNLWSVSNDER